MARATHRLDLLVLPRDPGAPADALAGVVAGWTAGGSVAGTEPDASGEGVTGGGGPPPVPSLAQCVDMRVTLLAGARTLVDGGVGQIVWMREESPRFLANRGGGFRVRCPVTGVSLADRLHRAMEGWRNGGARVLTCACGETHDLAVLDYVPDAGFARGWIELHDVGAAELVAEARALASDVRLVLRRG